MDTYQLQGVLYENGGLGIQFMFRGTGYGYGAGIKMVSKTRGYGHGVIDYREWAISYIPIECDIMQVHQ